MFKPVNSSVNSVCVCFREYPQIEHDKKQKRYDKDTLLKDNLSTRLRIEFDKFTNAATIYPAKGLTGDKNSNFYEFLTLGTVPYIIGSLTLMGAFNLANKYFEPYSRSRAAKYGNKMALGVLFYGLAKNLSQPLITEPVKFKTGVDVNMPYARVVYELPDNKYDTDITSIEYHKVFESVEFPRWDLLYADETKGEKRNKYYDKIAKKMGLGENLPDSDQEVKPHIREVVTKTIAVKNIVPYLWAAAGVALAVQKPWEDFFPHLTFKFWQGKKFLNCLSTFGYCFKQSVKELYTGANNGLGKYSGIAGKLAIFTPIVATILGDLAIMHKNHNKKQTDINLENVIQKDRKYVVD